MSAPVRGRCLIINNRHFDRPATPAPGQLKFEDRDGSEIDEENISKVFKKLSFICDMRTNLTSKVYVFKLCAKILKNWFSAFKAVGVRTYFGECVK